MTVVVHTADLVTLVCSIVILVCTIRFMNFNPPDVLKRHGMIEVTLITSAGMTFGYVMRILATNI